MCSGAGDPQQTPETRRKKTQSTPTRDVASRFQLASTFLEALSTPAPRWQSSRRLPSLLCRSPELFACLRAGELQQEGLGWENGAVPCRSHSIAARFGSQYFTVCSPRLRNRVSRVKSLSGEEAVFSSFRYIEPPCCSQAQTRPKRESWPGLRWFRQQHSVQ